MNYLIDNLINWYDLVRGVEDWECSMKQTFWYYLVHPEQPTRNDWHDERIPF